MVALETALFGIGAALGTVNLLGILASALGWLEYWPPGERSPSFYLHWGISMGLNACILALTALDWNGMGLSQPVALAVGLAVFVPSYGAALLAGRDLGTEETMGLEGELRTGGWYRYSRNPQYVCYLVAMPAFALVAASTPVAVLCGIYVLWWVLLPFAEEPWLREQYGDEYDEYAARVPRFVGVETIRRLVVDRNDADPSRA